MLIQFLLVWLLLSIGFSFSFSSRSCLKKSLMSSSLIFLGLPIALLVLYLELRSGLHSAAFFSHLFHSVNSQFSVPISISFFVGPVPASDLCIFHLVQCIYNASLYVINPFFLFNRSCIHFLIRIVFKCHLTVHVILSFCALTVSTFVIGATHFGDVNFSILFFGLYILFLNLFVFPFRLDNES